MVEHLEHRVGGPFRRVPAQQVMKIVEPRNLPLLGLRVAQQREQRRGKRGGRGFVLEQLGNQPLPARMFGMPT